MKKNYLIFALTSGMAIALATGFSIKEAKKLKVGDFIDGNKEIVAINENPSKIKYKPLVVPTDTYYPTQKSYSMNSVGDIETTWDYYKGDGIKIAIIDSGITYGHEDFPNLLNQSAYFETSYYTVGGKEYSETTKTLATSDNWQCMKHEYDTDYSEWDTHGSNVAGCAAAALNGKGTVGIAPNAQILMCKIDFYDESINEAIKYATDQGCDVINMSLGGYDDDDYPSGESHWAGAKTGNADAIAYAIEHGVIVVAAAGNEKSSAYSYPACNDGVIGVGALAKNSTTTAASFSNYNKTTDTKNGNHNVDVMAPGVVYAPGLDESELGNSKNDYPKLGYSETQGTSFASPIVAGAAALWKQKYHGTPAQFEEHLYDRAVNMNNFTKFGNGRLDVYKLLDIENEGIELSTTSLTLNTKSADQTVTATSNDSTIKSWSSSNTSVVSVSGATGSKSSTATVHVVGAGTTQITVTDNNNNTAKISVTVSQYISVTGINTTLANNAEIKQGKSANIGASVTPSNASEQGITYTSNNPSIATVDSTGKITGIAIGQTSITMNASDNVSKTLNIKVIENTSEEYSIIFKDNGGSSDGTQAKSALNDIVDSSDITISSCSANKIYQAQDGRGIKFSTSNVNGSLTLTLSESLNIDQVIVNAAKYSNDASTLSVNDSTSQDISDNDFNDYTFNINESTSSLSLEAVKRIYVKGLTIITSGGGSSTVSVESVNVSPTSLSLNVGEHSSLTATVLPTNATNKSVTWSSSNNSIASVTNGTVTANSVGTATITVTTVDGGKTANCTVTVTLAPVVLSSISVTGAKTSYEVGDAFVKPTVTAYYSNSTSKDVSSSATFTGYDLSKDGVSTVTVSYTEDSVTKTTSYQITVGTGVETTPLSSFFDGTITLKTSRNSLTNSDWFDIKGVVVGINGYQYYIQDGEYGILVFNEIDKYNNEYLYTYYEGIAVGDYVLLHTRVYSYNNLVETNSRDSAQTVTKLGTAALPEAVEYNTVSNFNSAHQSIRASLFNVAIDENNISAIDSADTSSDFSFNVYDINNKSNTAVVFIHRNTPNKESIISKLKTITTEDTLEFIRVVVSYYNGNQISLSSADQIVIHSPSEDKLAAWGVNYLFIGNPAFDGDGTGACKTANYYKEAKAALFTLEASESGNIAKLQSDSTYSAELARYLAWAKACEDATPFVNDYSFMNNAEFNSVSNMSDGGTMIIIITIATISSLAFTTLLIIKRKKK